MKASSTIRPASILIASALALHLAALAGCADDGFLFQVEVSGITTETVTVDGVPQTPADGKVVVTREFGSWYDTTDPLPPAVEVIVESGGQALMTKAFTPGWSCGSEPMTWQTETDTITLGGAMPDVTCLCERGDDSLSGCSAAPQ